MSFINELIFIMKLPHIIFIHNRIGNQIYMTLRKCQQRFLGIDILKFNNEREKEKYCDQVQFQ